MSPPMGMAEAFGKLDQSRRSELEPTLILWVGIGWLFAFQSRRYMETRAVHDRAVGGYQLVTESGHVVGFNAARHWQQQIVEWAEQNGLRHRVLDWVVEQRDIFLAASG